MTMQLDRRTTTSYALLRWIMAIGAVSLLIAAALHAGLIIPGPYDSAAMYETIIAVILVIGIGVTFLSGPWARWGALVTLVVSVAGASVGLFLAIRGAGPNTVPDLMYHVGLVLWLLAGVVVAWRS
jgi:hypothetical protein